MKRIQLGAVAVAFGLLASGVVSVACSPQEDSSRGSTPADPSQWEWVGISQPVELLDKHSRNNVFWASGNSTGEVQSYQAVYYPSMQRFDDGWVVPNRDSLLFLDEQLQVKSQFDVGEGELNQQLKGVGSVDGSAVVLNFDVSDQDNSYASRLFALNDHGIHSFSITDYVSSMRACDDGSATWLTEAADSGDLGLVRMDPSGDTTEVVLETPDGTELTSGATLLGCSEEGSYLGFYDDSHGLHAYAVEGSWPDVALQEDWDIGDLFPKTEEGQMNRSFQVLDGKLYSFLHEGRLIALDFENHEVHQSEVLLPPDTNPVSATVDGENIYVVTQPRGGARELRVHSFSLRDPQPSDGGFLLEGFFAMPHSDGGNPYAVPINVYPARR